MNYYLEINKEKINKTIEILESRLPKEVIHQEIAQPTWLKNVDMFSNGRKRILSLYSTKECDCTSCEVCVTNEHGEKLIRIASKKFLSEVELYCVLRFSKNCVI